MSSIKIPRQQNQVFEIDGETVEILPEVLNEGLAYLMLSWERAGRPKSVFSDGGQKLMDTIISSWKDIYPKESRDWLRAREEYQSTELSIKDQIKTHSGRSLASIPLYIHKMMKAFFKDDTNLDRDYYIRLVKLYPIFRMANKI